MNFIPQWNGKLHQHGMVKSVSRVAETKSYNLFGDQSPLVGDAANHDTKLSHLGEDDTAGNSLSNRQMENQRNQRDDNAFPRE